MWPTASQRDYMVKRDPLRFQYFAAEIARSIVSRDDGVSVNVVNDGSIHRHRSPSLGICCFPNAMLFIVLALIFLNVLAFSVKPFLMALLKTVWVSVVSLPRALTRQFRVVPVSLYPIRPNAGDAFSFGITVRAFGELRQRQSRTTHWTAFHFLSSNSVNKDPVKFLAFHGRIWHYRLLTRVCRAGDVHSVARHFAALSIADRRVATCLQ
jgi:hypothetical protein